MERDSTIISFRFQWQPLPLGSSQGSWLIINYKIFIKISRINLMMKLAPKNEDWLDGDRIGEVGRTNYTPGQLLLVIPLRKFCSVQGKVAIII